MTLVDLLFEQTCFFLERRGTPFDEGKTLRRGKPRVAVFVHRDGVYFVAGQPAQALPGRKMQQAGGVPRRAMWSSLDAKATPFGDYDRAIIEAVSQRWYDLLDSRRFAQDRSGKVILRFKLKPDGTIIEMQTTDNTVGELLGYLCHEAIEEAAGLRIERVEVTEGLGHGGAAEVEGRWGVIAEDDRSVRAEKLWMCTAIAPGGNRNPGNANGPFRSGAYQPK